MILKFYCIVTMRRQWHPLQYSCLENPMDRGAWQAVVHGVVKSWTWFHFHFHALEKEMAAHSSVLTWRIPGTGEPGGLPSMGSHRVGYDWLDAAAAAAVACLLGPFLAGRRGCQGRISRQQKVLSKKGGHLPTKNTYIGLLLEQKVDFYYNKSLMGWDY